MGTLKALCLLLIVTLSQSFYIYLVRGTAQCFYHHIFGDQQLLVEVETPIISVADKIVIRITANSEVVLEKDIINLVKITVPRASFSINDQTTHSQYQYETCFKVEDYKEGDSNDGGDEQASIDVPKGYLISVKLMTNFSHKLQDNQEAVQKENIDYRQIEKVSERLMQLNSEQINLHQISEMKEKLTQTYLQALKGKVIIYSIIEIFIILIFTIVQLRLLKGYINDISII